MFSYTKVCSWKVMSIHTQGITLGRKYRNHLHIRIIQAYEGLKLRPFSIFLFISISIFEHKKTAKGFYTYDGFVNSQTNFVSLNKLECKETPIISLRIEELFLLSLSRISFFPSFLGLLLRIQLSLIQALILHLN